MSNPKQNSRKQKQLFNSLIPFIIVVAAITGLIAYLWIYSEVDETLNDLEKHQLAVTELNDDINNLRDNIEYYARVDILTARAKNELGMVFTTPETIAIYVDEKSLIDN